MKRTVLLLGLAFTGYYAAAQNFQLISQDGQHITVGHQLKELPYQYTNIGGTSYVDFGKTHRVLSTETGAPALPLFNTSVQLPAKGNSIIVVEYDQVTEIQNVSIAPSKGNLKRNVNPSEVPYTFGAAYGENAFYPANVASLNEPFVWRSLRGQTITLSPYQYNPVTKTLRIHENLRVRVVLQSEVEGLNETAVSKVDRVMGEMQQRFFLNTSATRYTALEEDGEMLVVTAPDFADEVQPLVNWKNQKGIKTTVISAPAGTTDTQLKTIVQDFYAAHPDLVYVLLVGDHAELPSHTYGNSGGEALWSDSYYGQLAGGANDYYPEVFVGRFSGTAAQITTMVNRTLEYERTPAAGDWMEKAIGLGSNEGQGIGNDGEPDWQHLRNIRARLMTYGYTTVYEFYDGSHGGEDATGSPNASIINPAVNAGVGLFNYTGHGDQNTCVTGNYSSTNINAATNNGMYPLVVSVACNNGTFTAGTCISEVWLRADNASTPAGAIGAAGSSILMAWAQPMQTQDEMAEIIAEAYPSNKKTTTGGLFYNGQMSMLEQYPSADGREVMQTWIYFGDPSTQFRNKQTMTLTTSQAAQVALGTTTMNINCDTDGALVAISQDNVLLGKAIVSGGVATITFPALASDNPLVVTATKQNYRPSQSAVQVGNGPLGIDELEASITVFPNPVSGAVNIVAVNNTIESAEVISITGQQVATFTAMSNGTMSSDLSHVAKGSYLVRIVTPKGVSMKHIEVLH